MSRSIHVDTSVLPSNVFDIRDDDFFSVIDRIVGVEETELMRIQSIRLAHSFLRIENIFDIFYPSILLILIP